MSGGLTAIEEVSDDDQRETRYLIFTADTQENIGIPTRELPLVPRS